MVRSACAYCTTYHPGSWIPPTLRWMVPVFIAYKSTGDVRKNKYTLLQIVQPLCLIVHNRVVHSINILKNQWSSNNLELSQMICKIPFLSESFSDSHCSKDVVLRHNVCQTATCPVPGVSCCVVIIWNTYTDVFFYKHHFFGDMVWCLPILAIFKERDAYFYNFFPTIVRAMGCCLTNHTRRDVLICTELTD